MAAAKSGFPALSLADSWFLVADPLLGAKPVPRALGLMAHPLELRGLACKLRRFSCGPGLLWALQLAPRS
jgi:hypothetical protein